MNKEQFLAALRARLTGLPIPELEQTLQYYREMVDDRIEEGMTEAAAVADVGDPDELAAAILQKPAKRTAVRAQQAPGARKPMSGPARAALIIIAAALIIVGVVLIAGSLSMRRDVKIKDYSFANAGIHSLEIVSGSAEVKLVPVSDEVCRVQCTESAMLRNSVWLEEGTLHIERRRAGKWSLYGIALKEDFIFVGLPAGDYESLWVESTSGGVSVPADFSFRSAIISATSGGVALSAQVTEELNIRTSSGGVALSDASPDSLFVQASSGGVAMIGMQPGSGTLTLSSGGMRLSDVHFSGDLTAESSSGAIRLSDVTADGTMDLECTSGAIRLEDCDASELHLRCTSGSISGRLLTPKIYVASATSGSVRVPESGGDGVCEARTTSGSIRFD